MRQHPPLLEIQNLSLNYGSSCVDKNITFSLNRGDVLGIAGESGSGKSTLLKAIIDPEGYGVIPTNGTIKYNGKDIVTMPCAQRRTIKGVEIGMVLQNPYAAFNPIRTYKKQFAETLKSHGLWRGQESVEEIVDLFCKLGLSDAKQILDHYPYEMSGGMNQRICIALAMILRPALLLADEPTSALDVTSQSKVLQQLRRLREISDVSVIIVSHNLSLLAGICDKTAIMHKGKIVEYGNTKEVLLQPMHWYTRRLLEAVCVLPNNRCGCHNPTVM